MAGVQRGGRGEVECEREARSLGARDRASRSHSTSPPSPLYAGHAGYPASEESFSNRRPTESGNREIYYVFDQRKKTTTETGSPSNDRRYRKIINCTGSKTVDFL